MSSSTDSRDHRNLLLATIYAAEPNGAPLPLERVELKKRAVLSEADQDCDFTYFIEKGFVSVVAPGANGRQTEVGIIGREGTSAIPAILGSKSWPLKTMMQHDGQALRMRCDDLLDAMVKRPAMRATMLGYVLTLMTQITATARANAHGKLEERLARWLLMSHDRVEGNELPLVHEFLAMMLGVRRPGVTVALHIMEGNGLIRADRGRITIIDREGLEDHAGGYYGTSEAEQARRLKAS